MQRARIPWRAEAILRREGFAQEDRAVPEAQMRQLRPDQAGVIGGQGPYDLLGSAAMLFCPQSVLW